MATHSHAGHHHHIDPESGDRRVGLAILVNLLLTGAQIIGGLAAGSLALIADALHNFSDAVSLIIAFAARKISRRPANAAMPFGYARIEIVAALINYTTLIVIGLYLILEAVNRFLDPQPTDGWLIIVIAAVALTIDLLTAALTYRLSKTSVNIRAAFLHNLADALGSLAVIIAGILIMLFGWQFVDPLATLLIAGYILWQAFAEIGTVIRLLMLGGPAHLDPAGIVSDLESLDGLRAVHQARLWHLDENRLALDAHLVIARGHWQRADQIKAAAKERLAGSYDIQFTTLELECSTHACQSAPVFGHQALSRA
ncbi:MAG: cation diffusion facilitator family transporter [Burkholderiaceae bacterium]